MARALDTAIILPSAMKGHIDHFIVREAGLKAMTKPSSNATFYFAEDKPYAGLLNDEEMRSHQEFVKQYQLIPRCFDFDKDHMIDLAYKHYPSQVDEVYRKDINARVLQLKSEYQTDRDLDCFYVCAR